MAAADEELKALFNTILGATPPPTKGKTVSKRIMKAISNVLAALLLTAFAVGLVDLIVLLVQALGKLL